MKKFSVDILILTRIMMTLVICSGCGIIQLPFMAPTNEDLKNNVQFNWMADSTEHFHFYIEQGSWAAKNIKQVKDDSEKEYKHILKLLNEPGYKSTIYYFIVKDRTRMDELIGRKINGCAYPNRDIVCAIASDSVRALGCHEIFHLISINLWEYPDQWISEGMAVYSDNSWWSNDLHSLAKHLSEEGKLLPLKKLADNFNSSDNMITYPQAGSVMKFIYEKYGFEKTKKLWSEGISGIKNALVCRPKNLKKIGSKKFGKSMRKKLNIPSRQNVYFK